MDNNSESEMNIQTDDRPNILMVDKDWSSSVLWIRKDKGMANCVSYDSFNLPKWLLRRFDFWSNWFESNHPSEINRKMDWKLWEAYGLSLAIDLKQIVGDKHVVYFGREQEIGIIPQNPA